MQSIVKLIFKNHLLKNFFLFDNLRLHIKLFGYFFILIIELSIPLSLAFKLFCNLDMIILQLYQLYSA